MNKYHQNASKRIFMTWVILIRRRVVLTFSWAESGTRLHSTYHRISCKQAYVNTCTLSWQEEKVNRLTFGRKHVSLYNEMLSKVELKIRNWINIKLHYISYRNCRQDKNWAIEIQLCIIKFTKWMPSFHLMMHQPQKNPDMINLFRMSPLRPSSFAQARDATSTTSQPTLSQLSSFKIRCTTLLN